MVQAALAVADGAGEAVFQQLQQEKEEEEEEEEEAKEKEGTWQMGRIEEVANFNLKTTR